jgi:Ca-activated chloride channel family protein
MSSNALQDLYGILGVPLQATADDIRRAYRVAARRFHPDVNKYPGAANQFRDIVAAYEVLSDVEQRRQYDLRRPIGTFEKNYINMRVIPSRRMLTAIPEQQVLYMLVDFSPDRSLVAQPKQSHSPLNLTLIIDRSLSMKGVRLDRTKVAAFQIIDHLSERDLFSMVAFSDRAEVLIQAAAVADKQEMKAHIVPVQTAGATEIYQGLLLGFQENMKYCSPRYVNHIILITDGHTYGDEKESLELAARAAQNGIGISALGIGDEWNDSFLDALASRTGGSIQYITTPNEVVNFINKHVRALSDALVDRVSLSLAPDPDVKIETIFRLSPSAQPLPIGIDPIPIGQLSANSLVSLIVALQLPALEPSDARSILRVDVTGDIVREQQRGYKTVTDSVLVVSDNAQVEDPPLAILDALSKLNLYRMQQRAEEALRQGKTVEATERLQKLATRYLQSGQSELAQVTMQEIQRLTTNLGTSALSEEGHKRLKYGTRMLMLQAGGHGEHENAERTQYFSDSSGSGASGRERGQ